jgi:hypothetical protein
VGTSFPLRCKLASKVEEALERTLIQTKI